MPNAVANGSLELRIAPRSRSRFLVRRDVGDDDSIGKEFRIIIFICNNLPGAFGARLRLTETLAKIRVAMTFEKWATFSTRYLPRARR